MKRMQKFFFVRVSKPLGNKDIRLHNPLKFYGYEYFKKKKGVECP